MSELQLGGPAELVDLWLLLNQAHDGARIDLSMLREMQLASGRAGLDLADAHALRAQSQRGDAEQQLGLIRQQAEAVDHFHLQLAQLLVIPGAGNALVHDQAGMHIRQVILGDQRRNAQIDLTDTLQAAFNVRGAAFADGLHRLVQHFRIESEADLLYVASLFFAKEFSCTANLQIVACQREAGSERAGRTDGLNALQGIRGHVVLVRRQQVGIGLVMRATNAAPQLVQLRKSELVRTVNDDGVRAGNVDAGLDDRGAHQDVVTLVIEVGHDLFQFPLRKLSMGHAHAGFWYQFLQMLAGLVDRLHFIVQVEHLSAPQQFPQHGFLDQGILTLANESLHRQTFGRWSDNE